MFYKYTVPKTKDMDSFSGTCSNYNRYMRPTYRQNALVFYNLFRGDKGLPPLERMPNGTTYLPVYDYDIEGDFGQGWEIVCCESTWTDARRTVREYRDNAPGSYRIMKRPSKTEPINACLAITKSGMVEQHLNNIFSERD